MFGFFLVLFAAGGAILGAALALVLDRRSVKRSSAPSWKRFPTPNRIDGQRAVAPAAVTNGAARKSPTRIT